MPQYCPSVCPSVTFRYRDHICSNTSKIISPPNSDKIVMWRFLRNHRLLLCLHTIFRALKYWAHRAVVLAIAWHLVVIDGDDNKDNDDAAAAAADNEWSLSLRPFRTMLKAYDLFHGGILSRL